MFPIKASHILLIGLLTIFPFTTKCEFTNEEGEWETMIIDLIKNSLTLLPMEEFVDDPQLNQKVDRINKISIYRKALHPSNSNEEEYVKVYTRNSMDLGEPIIILRSQEDNLKVFTRKRTFVALRQNPLSNSTYFVSYVYLRFQTDKQKDCTETYLNEKICLEFDTWDNDRGEIKTKQKYFGWTDCASSFLSSCRSDLSLNTSVNENRSSSTPLADRGYRNASMNYDPTGLDKQFDFLPQIGLAFDDSIEVFWDLEINSGEALYILETIKYSSVFSNPQGFVVEGNAAAGGGNSMGRSLLGGKNDTTNVTVEIVQDKLQEQKDVAKNEAVKKSLNKKLLFNHLSSRKDWFLRKNELSSLIRKISKEMGFGDYYKLQNNPEKLNKFRSLEKAMRILEELESLGDEFEMNEVVLDEPKTLGKGNNGTEEEGTKLIQQADEEPEGAVGDGLATAFGNALTQITAKGGTGRSVGEGDSNVAQNIAKSVLFSSTDTFQIPGWKLKSIQEDWSPRDALGLESNVFYGLGSCPSQTQPSIKINFEDFINAKPSLNQIIDFYLNVWGTNCSNEAREYLIYLVQIKYLSVENGAFILPKDLFQSQKLKLRTNELRKLSAALEISSFSQNYGMETKHNYNWTNGLLTDEDFPSRSVHYLTEFVFLFLKQGRQLADNHFIKLVRNLVITLKGVMTKLLQDREILLSKCPSCKLLETMNTNDRLAIHSLIEFILRGLAPVEQDSNLLIDHLYKDFVQRNSNILKKGLQLYS